MLYDRLIQSAYRAGRTEVFGGSDKSLLWLLDCLCERAVQFGATHGIRLIRISLATVFIWFGLLKIIGSTPVFDLVAQTVYWLPLPPEFFVPFLGMWEMLLGFWLLFGVLPRLTLFLFLLHMAGTFLVLVLQPNVAFQGGNLLLLTAEGEFVIKNLVLIAAGLVLLASTIGAERGGESFVGASPTKRPSDSKSRPWRVNALVGKNR